MLGIEDVYFWWWYEMPIPKNVSYTDVCIPEGMVVAGL